jgi:hypothetical protein
MLCGVHQAQTFYCLGNSSIKVNIHLFGSVHKWHQIFQSISVPSPYFVMFRLFPSPLWRCTSYVGENCWKENRSLYYKFGVYLPGEWNANLKVSVHCTSEYMFLVSWYCSRNSRVGTTLRVRVEWTGNRGSIPNRGNIISSSPQCSIRF